MVYSICVAAFCAVLAWQFWLGSVRINFEAQWVTGFAILVGFFVLFHHYLRLWIIRKFLTPHGGFVCLRCHYPLRRLPDNGVCPECGTQYTRPQVVELWERTYRLRQRFPRVSEHTPAPGPVRVEVSQVPAWRDVSLRSALAKVEAVARKHGYASRRFPLFAQTLEDDLKSLGGRVPSDLYLFLGWFDQALWSHFINRHQSWTSDLGNVIMPTGEPIVAGHPADGPADLIRIFPPSSLQVTKLEDASADHVFIGYFLDCFDVHKRPEAWRNTRVIVFGNTRFGEPLAYCTDPPEGRPGSIITFTREADRIWLADSLAEWLARLAAFDGIEYVFRPGDIGNLDPQLTAAFLSEFREHNPRSSLFTA